MPPRGVAWRGGASRNLSTPAQSPGDVRLGSVRQWERARGYRSKVNGRGRLPRRGRAREGCARGPQRVCCACALGAGPLAGAPLRAASGASARGGASRGPGPRRGTLPQETRWRQWPRKGRCRAAANDSYKSHRTIVNVEKWTGKRGVSHCYLIGCLLGEVATRPEGAPTPVGKVRARAVSLCL